jgi:hypothetical protein
LPDNKSNISMICHHNYKILHEMEPCRVTDDCHIESWKVRPL